MRIRKKPLGDKNLVGARIESIRRNRGMKQKELLAQLQVRGVDINASALSKLEGQLRTVTDIELLAFAEILDVDVFWAPHRRISATLNQNRVSTARQLTRFFFCGFLSLTRLSPAPKICYMQKFPESTQLSGNFI